MGGVYMAVSLVGASHGYNILCGGILSAKQSMELATACWRGRGGTGDGVAVEDDISPPAPSTAASTLPCCILKTDGRTTGTLVLNLRL